MDNNSISSPYSEITLIVPEPNGRVSETDRSAGDRVRPVVFAWPVTQIDLPAPTMMTAPPPVALMYPKPSVKVAIDQFVKQVASVAGTKCIVIEEADGQIIHVTTFAEPLSEESRQKIYAIEAATIDAFSDLVFDFHLRSGSEVDGATPIPIPGQRFFAVWGTLHENAE